MVIEQGFIIIRINQLKDFTITTMIKITYFYKDYQNSQAIFTISFYFNFLINTLCSLIPKFYHSIIDSYFKTYFNYLFNLFIYLTLLTLFLIPLASFLSNLFYLYNILLKYFKDHLNTYLIIYHPFSLKVAYDFPYLRVFTLINLFFIYNGFEVLHFKDFISSFLNYLCKYQLILFFLSFFLTF